ncbi:hypothetical protein EVAR_17763_1 [Eumeta japonica]|uniref:Uncharacterized protein n=1 Tax=Eumeta variegata TaxID=151549 RepID=A0A4C1TTC7_EUMVA|nr:hypothetical protein EVAR_17763_1 [Eumeta japonica]
MRATKSKWSPQPIDARSPKGVTSALPAFQEGIPDYRYMEIMMDTEKRNEDKLVKDSKPISRILSILVYDLYRISKTVDKYKARWRTARSAAYERERWGEGMELMNDLARQSRRWASRAALTSYDRGRLGLPPATPADGGHNRAGTDELSIERCTCIRRQLGLSRHSSNSRIRLVDKQIHFTTESTTKSDSKFTNHQTNEHG